MQVLALHIDDQRPAAVAAMFRPVGRRQLARRDVMRLHLDDEPIGEIKRVSLAPDDVIVVQIDRRLNASEAHQIRERLADYFAGHKICVVSDGAKLSIVSTSGDQGAEAKDEPTPYPVAPDVASHSASTAA